jgi:Lar family restriction alleviation protein
MSELKPCPFCGCANIKIEEVETVLQWVEFYEILCPECNANIEEESTDVLIKKWNTRAYEVEKSSASRVMPNGIFSACKAGAACGAAVNSYYECVLIPDKPESENQSITLLRVVSPEERIHSFWETACIESTLLNVVVGGGDQALTAVILDAFVQEWKVKEGVEQEYERIKLFGKVAYVNTWWKAPQV